MTGIEYVDSDSKSPFPAAWGRAPGGAYSEERARWVKAKVREEMRGSSMRTLRMRQLQMLVHLRQRLYEGEQDG
jgi:hypothetical protein